jgi:hypothetical protein
MWRWSRDPTDLPTLQQQLQPRSRLPGEEDEMSDKELTQAMTDAVIFGTGVMQDGKRIDPQSFFVQPASDPVCEHCGMDPAALTEQLEAARADAKEAEAYADELAEDQVDLCRQLIAAEDKLAKVMEAASPLLNMDVWTESAEDAETVIVSVGTVRRIRATLAELEGDK